MAKSDSITVLFLSRYGPEAHGPAWERIRHLAAACDQVLGKTLILTLQNERGKVNERKDSKVLLYEVKLPRESPFPINALFDPIKFLALTIHGLIFSARFKPRIILASMPPSEVGVSAWIIAKSMGKHLIIDLRDDWESALKQKLSNYIPAGLLKVIFWFALRVYSSSNAILVATRVIGKNVQEQEVEKPILFASNGANTSIFIPQRDVTRKKLREKFAIPQDKLVLLYCGSGINPYYRLDRILSVLGSLTSETRNRLLLLFYLYNGIETVQAMKNNLNMTDELVELRAPVSRPVLAEIMAACDVGLVPFDNAPYLLCARSTKLYEYLSAGLFVIATGPKGGELDVFFASNPAFGKFSLPYRDSLTDVFQWIVENEEQVSVEDNRFLRHKFIQENYERMGIMIRTLRKVRSLLSIDTK